MVKQAGIFFHRPAAGDLLSKVEIARTGLDEDPIDLRLLANGELIIAGQQPASLRLCRPESWSCGEIAHGVLAGVKRQFKILPGRLAGQWLLTDSRGDALWEWNEGQLVLQERLPPRTLAGPNGLALDVNGHLWIADTDKRRIVEVVPVEEGWWVTGREHSAVNELTTKERYYPMMLEPASDGRLWVVQAADFAEAQADLVIYEPEQGAVVIVGLRDGAYPTDLAVLGDSVLVSDMERFAVYRVDSETREVSDFGDGRFLDQMVQYQATRQLYGRLGTLSLAVIVPLFDPDVCLVLSSIGRRH